MTRFLLGDLPEEERSSFEESFLADQALYEQLLAVENDLIDSYLRGGLTARERQRFESEFLASPPRRERVEFARNLIGFFSEPSEATVDRREMTTDRPFRWWQSLLSPFRALNPNLGFALAVAALLMALGGLWLFVTRTRQPIAPQITQSEQSTPGPQTRELEPRLSQQPDQTDANQPPRQGERAASENQSPAELPGRNSNLPRQPRREPSRPVVAAFSLTPGLVRDASAPVDLIVPPQATQVQLILLPDSDKHLSYRAVLTTAEGKSVLNRSALKPHATRAGRAVVLQVPATRLSGGDYVIELRGATPAGDFERVSEYSFRIVRK